MTTVQVIILIIGFLVGILVSLELFYTGKIWHKIIGVLNIFWVMLSVVCMAMLMSQMNNKTYTPKYEQVLTPKDTLYRKI